MDKPCKSKPPAKRLFAARSRKNISMPRIIPISLAPSQTRTFLANKAFGKVRTVPCKSALGWSRQVILPRRRTIHNCDTVSSLIATGEWVVVKICGGESLSLDPIAWSSLIIRWGSRPCSSSSSNTIGCCPAPATSAEVSSLAEPVPKSRSGTSFWSCNAMQLSPAPTLSISKPALTSLISKMAYSLQYCFASSRPASASGDGFAAYPSRAVRKAFDNTADAETFPGVILDSAESRLHDR